MTGWTHLANEDPPQRVEGNDALHARGRKHHLVSDGDASTNKSRVSALRDHREAPIVAVPQHARYLLRCLWENRHGRLTPVLLHPVHVEGLEIVGRGLDVVSADYRPEQVEVGIVYACVAVGRSVLTGKNRGRGIISADHFRQRGQICTGTRQAADGH